jgi:hypothetical protein
MPVYVTRGIRQSKNVEVWKTAKPPVLVRGDWRHPSAPNEPKRFWLPAARMADWICLLTFGCQPQPGERIRLRKKNGKYMRA